MAELKTKRREGDWFLTGFSPRKQNLTLYIMAGFKEFDEVLKNGKAQHGEIVPLRQASRGHSFAHAEEIGSAVRQARGPKTIVGSAARPRGCT